MTDNFDVVKDQSVILSGVVMCSIICSLVIILQIETVLLSEVYMVKENFALVSMPCQMEGILVRRRFSKLII